MRKAFISENTMLKARVYSLHTHKALSLLGKMIQLHRKERKLTTQDLADRANISRITLRKIENGDPKCEIGIVFEIAAIVGIKLFDADVRFTDSLAHQINDKIALLPKSIRISKEQIDDNF